MLTPDSWKAHTANLEPGRSRRVSHDCGEGRTLIVSREGNDYKAYCFRCGEPGFIDGPEETMSQKLARLTEQRVAEARIQGAELPMPMVRAVADWPDEARLWFFKAGLSSHDIGRLGAYYHPPTKRVVLPLYKGEHAVFWQARALNGQQPKYMAADVDKSLVLPRYGKAERITLTEDILSAYKVGSVGEGWCLMGTSLNAHTLSELMRRQCPVNVWLDNDLPPVHRYNKGQVAADKVGKVLRAMGCKVRNIVAPLDPKLMSRDQIKELIS
jgi:hypothetical protein